MGILKKEPNPVGRPSKESLKKKRNQKILVGVLATVAVLLVGGTVLLISTGTDLTQLMGNSTTKTVIGCPNGYKYESNSKKCVSIKGAKLSCPTGGYTLINGKCQKQKSSTSGIQAIYDSKTKTYKCPSDTSTSTTITKYVKSGKTTCIKNVFEVKSPTKSCEIANSAGYIEPGYNLSGNSCIKSVSTVTSKLIGNPKLVLYKETITKEYVEIYMDNIRLVSTGSLGATFGVEYYKYNNGKWEEYFFASTNDGYGGFNLQSLITVKTPQNSSSKYKARAYIVDINGKKIYSNFSNILTIDTNKISS